MARTCSGSATTRMIASVAATAVGAMVLVAEVRAQWTVTVLTPPGAIGRSAALGVREGEQVGEVSFDLSRHASLWSGTAGTWVDLHPAGAASSFASCTSGGQQYGGAYFGSGGTRAGMWSGTAASWNDLHPLGATDSAVYGVGGGQQVGYAYIDHAARAGMWSGSAASWVALHPSGAAQSAAYAAWGGRQVGYASFGGHWHAGLWSGTAGSWVDLHPAGSSPGSAATGAWGDQQVGTVDDVYFDRIGWPYLVPRAALWRGTAESWVDLHPAGAYMSSANAVWDGLQAGSVMTDGPETACVWSGTAASCQTLPLPQAPAWLNSSAATGIWSDGTSLYVSGRVFSSDDGSESVAVLWSRPVPAPGAVVGLGVGSAWALRARRRRSSAGCGASRARGRGCLSVPRIGRIDSASGQFPIRTLRPRGRVGALILAAAAGFASEVRAQWTVTVLTPPGASGARASGVRGGEQVGVTSFGSSGHAGLWRGTAGTWVDLNPAGAESSFASSTSGGQQFGGAFFGNGGTRAGMWSGTAASWTDLHPVGALDSAVYGAGGGQQVGYAYIDHAARASMWSGSAGSWVGLHPPAATQSAAYATWGGRQVGYASVGGPGHAALWSGTAGSWVDLHPSGLGPESAALGVWGDQQVGSVGSSDPIQGIYFSHAGLWRGNAASWVDLHPAGAERSVAEAVWDGLQAGRVLRGVWRASIWSGSAASWEELPLPPSLFELNSSTATGIWSDGTTVYVSGHGFHSDDGSPSEALLWSRPVPAPAAPIALIGFGGFAAVRRRRGR